MTRAIAPWRTSYDAAIAAWKQRSGPKAHQHEYVQVGSVDDWAKYLVCRVCGEAHTDWIAKAHPECIVFEDQDGGESHGA